MTIAIRYEKYSISERGDRIQLRLFRLVLTLGVLVPDVSFQMVQSPDLRKPIIPTQEETHLSENSSRILAAHLHPERSTQHLKIVEEDGNEHDVVVPSGALHLLVDILSQMAQGNSVTLIPVHAELTTQEAADILNVSRPFLIKLVDTGEIPCRKVGRHRRIRYDDLMTYKQHNDGLRRQALDELAAMSQELNLYD